MNDTTIVHINVSLCLATVTYNGIARLYRLKHINPVELANVYKKRGYKYSWIAADTILLTKKVQSIKAVAA